MAKERPVIENVSDTARWVAVYRAIESERPDALFHDRFARALAGARGHAIVDELPGADSSAGPIIVRTAVFDAMIRRAIEVEGVDLVINLAAGLDTRPYRLALPPTLRWVEIDLPGIIEHKESVLRAEKPNCQLSRFAVDLSDVDARRKAFRTLTQSAKRVFVLTEGLLMYLTPEQVASLASDLAEQPAIRFWAADIIGPLMKFGLNLMWHRTLSAGNATFHFAPGDGAEFFRPYGWKVREYRAADEESIRYDRLPRFAQAWKYTRRLSTRRMRDLSRISAGYVLLETAATTA